MKLDIDRRVKDTLKALASVLLLSYIIYSTGPYKIWNQLNQVDLWFFFMVIVITIVKVGISAKKWQVLLRAKEEVKSLLYVWKIYYIGTFFNLFLPTNVGGDVIKAHKMSKTSQNSVEAYSSVFMERFTGLAAILILALVSTTLYLEELPLQILLLIYFVVTPLILGTGFLLLRKSLIQRFSSIYERIFGSFNPFSIREKVGKLYNSINLYRHKKKALTSALAISLLFHLLLILTNYILALSIGMNVAIHYFFIFIPISAVLLFLPISIKGFGVREVIYVYFFTNAGATAAQAVSLSFLVHLVGIISSIIGGLVYLYSKIK